MSYSDYFLHSFMKMVSVCIRDYIKGAVLNYKRVPYVQPYCLMVW